VHPSDHCIKDRLYNLSGRTRVSPHLASVEVPTALRHALHMQPQHPQDMRQKLIVKPFIGQALACDTSG